MHLPEIAVFTSILLLCHCFAGAFQESLMGHLLREVIQNPIEALIQFLKCNFIITSVQETHQGGAVFPQMDRCGIAQLHPLRLPFPLPLVLNILAEPMASWEKFENFRTSVFFCFKKLHCCLPDFFCQTLCVNSPLSTYSSSTFIYSLSEYSISKNPSLRQPAQFPKCTYSLLLFHMLSIP